MSTRAGGGPALAEIVPETFAEVAEALAAANADGRVVRIAGAGTKPWAASAGDPDDAVALRTAGLASILAHDPGDMTASLQAGVALADAQAAFAEKGQTLSLDPPLGTDETATIGGVVASGDCGPLAHRYGGPRDLVVGAGFALADGTIARSGGTVIKNVAGYDVAKLLCGSFGTLGVILSVNVRLHPLHPAITVHGISEDRDGLTRAALKLSALPAELEALDVAFADGTGTLLARVSGAQATERATRIAGAMREAGLSEVESDPEGDDDAWTAQRSAQRSAHEAVLHIAAAPARLAAVLDAVHAVDGRLVGRAALGHSHVTLAPDRIPALRTALPPGAVSVLRDCPSSARAAVADPWGVTPPATLALMRALKDRFDPAGTCNPHCFVGGI